MASFTTKSSTLLQKTASNPLLIFLLVFGFIFMINSTPVYASDYYELKMPQSYTTPFVNSLTVDKAKDLLQYVHNFMFPNFADTHYYSIGYTGGGTERTSSFRYILTLWPKSGRYYMQGNGYTHTQITTYGARAHAGIVNYQYDFYYDGGYAATRSGGTGAWGAGIPFNTYYYMSFPALRAANYDGNFMAPEYWHDPYTRGKVYLSDDYYKSSTTVLGQGVSVSDANLTKMLDVINEKEPYWNITYSYLLRPVMASTLITHWQLLLIPNREDSNYVFNRFLAYDFETTEWIDSIALETNGTKFPLQSYVFNTNFVFLSNSVFEDMSSVNYTHVPVSYSDVPTELRLVSAQSPDPSIYYTVKDSPELRASVGQRPFPATVLNKYTSPPDVQLASGHDIPVDVLNRMFLYVGTYNQDWFVNKGNYTVYTQGDNYVVALSKDGYARFLAEREDNSRWFGLVLKKPKSPIVKWHYWAPAASVGGPGILFYTFNFSGDYVRMDSTIEPFIRNTTTAIHYSNTLCSSYQIGSGIVRATTPNYDCANYGLRAVPAAVYNEAFVQTNDGLQFIDGSYNQDHTIETTFPDLLNILNNFFRRTDTLKPLIGFMPPTFIVLADVSLKIFIFMLVYKLIRIIRGLTL